MLLGGGSLSGKLKVSNLIQKSGIVVDEKRTIDILDSITGKYNKIKYTKILFFPMNVILSLNYEIDQKVLGREPKEFIADHPFIFYIEDDITGAKLFAGRVSNPEY